MPAAAGVSQHLFCFDAAGQFASPTLRALRAGYDRLARHEWQGGAKLPALRKKVADLEQRILELEAMLEDAKIRTK